MAQAVRHSPLSFLNTDGKAHPVENSLTAVTLVLGLVAFITAFWPDLNIIASWAGLAGIIAGAWGQFISATTAERFLLIIGLGMSAVGFYLGMAHGGLFG
jgi:uncharacterized membrane protein